MSFQRQRENAELDCSQIQPGWLPPALAHHEGEAAFSFSESYKRVFHTIRFVDHPRFGPKLPTLNKMHPFGGGVKNKVDLCDIDFLSGFRCLLWKRYLEPEKSSRSVPGFFDLWKALCPWLSVNRSGGRKRNRLKVHVEVAPSRR